MSTVVDSNKYIINGSTLSDIGDVLTSYLGPGTVHQQESNIYYISGSGYGNQTISFDESYFGISGVQKMKFIVTSITGYNDQGGKLSGSNNQPSVSLYSSSINKEYIYTLSAGWQGQTWTSQGLTRASGCTFKVYPLNARGDVIIPDSETISSKNYQSEATTIKVIQPRTVADIAQSITDMAALPPSASGLQVDFAPIFTRGYGTAPTTTLSGIGVSDISDIYFIVGYDAYNYYGLVYLDLIHNPDPVGTLTLGTEVCPTYNLYRIPKNTGSASPNTAYTSTPSLYATIAYSKQQNLFYSNQNYGPNGIVKNSSGYPEYMMIIHKPASSS